MVSERHNNFNLSTATNSKIAGRPSDFDDALTKGTQHEVYTVCCAAAADADDVSRDAPGTQPRERLQDEPAWPHSASSAG